MSNPEIAKRNNGNTILTIIVILSTLWLIVEILYYLTQYNLNPLQDSLSKLSKEIEIQYGLNITPSPYLLTLMLVSIFSRIIWLFSYYKKVISSFLLFYAGQLLAIAITFKTSYFVNNNYYLLGIQIALLLAFIYANWNLFSNLYPQTKQIMFFILTTFSLYVCFANLINLTRIVDLHLKNSLFSICLFILTTISIISILLAYLQKYKSLLFYVIAQTLLIVLYIVDFIVAKSYYSNFPDDVNKLKIDFIDNIAHIVILVIGFSLYMVKYIYRKDKEILAMVENIGKE